MQAVFVRKRAYRKLCTISMKGQNLVWIPGMAKRWHIHGTRKEIQKCVTEEKGARRGAVVVGTRLTIRCERRWWPSAMISGSKTTTERRYTKWTARPCGCARRLSSR